MRLRALAYLLDVVLLFVVLGPAGWLVQRALGISPSTGPQIWGTLLLNFSLPCWVYFTVADASAGGATFGKRWLGIRVVRERGGSIAPLRALGRTAAKLLPWELVHLSAFGLAGDLGELHIEQSVGLVLANALAVAYLVCAAMNRGRRSVHDLIAGTAVQATA